MRVVSLTCSNTEIVTALGAADWLVGVDDHSDFPPDVIASLPRVGPDLDIDVELVKQLEPDLVLASLTVPGHERVVQRIADSGLNYLAPKPQSLVEVGQSFRDVGAALGLPDQAEELALQLQARAQLPAANGSAARLDRAPSVLVQWWPKPVIAPGRLSWVHDMLISAGATHPLAGESVESRPMVDNEVAESSPDAVIIAWCGVEPHKVRPEVVACNPSFAALPAVRNGHVYCVPEAWLGRPSPRLAHGMEALDEVVAAVVNGELAGPELRHPQTWAEGLDR